jgi:hypothetical protein
VLGQTNLQEERLNYSQINLADYKTTSSSIGNSINNGKRASRSSIVLNNQILLR